MEALTWGFPVELWKATHCDLCAGQKKDQIWIYKLLDLKRFLSEGEKNHGSNSNEVEGDGKKNREGNRWE